MQIKYISIFILVKWILGAKHGFVISVFSEMQ